MRSASLIRSAVLLVTLLGLANVAQAKPITYEISAMASGQIGGTTFTDALVELIGTGNTANVTSLFSGEAFANPFDSFEVTIAGVGTATITDPSGIWAVPTPGFDSIPVPVVVIGREDHVGGVPVLDSITGLGVVGGNALAGYEGTTGIGPITDEGAIGFPACGGPTEDPCVHTTLGLLSFSANLRPTTLAGGQGTFTATVASTPTPEPASGALILCGLAALAALHRRRSPRAITASVKGNRAAMAIGSASPGGAPKMP
jgi:hypothetical protein